MRVPTQLVAPRAAAFSFRRNSARSASQGSTFPRKSRTSREQNRHFLVLFRARALPKRTASHHLAFVTHALLAVVNPTFTISSPCRTAGYVACAALAWATLTSEAAANPSQLVPEVGYNYGEVETGRSAAMGGALRALGNAVTGLYLNPANIALTRAAHLQADAQIWPQASRQSYGASIVDSVTGRLAAGVGGHYNVLDPSGVDRKWTDARLALAFPLSDKFYVGATGKYLKLRENGLSAPKFGLPASPASGGLDQEPIVDGLTFDLGLTVKPSNQLLIGLLGSNLTSPGNGYQPTSLGGGVGIGTDDMTIEGDVVADFTTFTKADGSSRTTMRAMAGFEYLAADHYPLRLATVTIRGSARTEFQPVSVTSRRCSRSTSQ